MSTEYQEFMLELDAEAKSEEEFSEHSFFRNYAKLTSESGYTEDLEHSVYRAQGLQIDGYYCDIDGQLKDILGTMTLIVCDYHTNTDELQSLNTDKINTLFKRAENFYKKCQKEEFFKNIPETHAAYPLAQIIYKYHKSLKKVRVYIFSNAKLATRMKRLETKNIDNTSFTYNIFDFEEYSKLMKAKAGRSEIEIDLEEYGAYVIPLINASIESSEYSSVLFALPCDLLANIYDDYKAQLLEQNVRTFLQARGEVNKGIIRTLKDTPERFFAYNNEITATATDIITKKDNKGQILLQKIKNLQIVNGGQTTASCFYAREKEKANLTKAFVQVKLSVVKDEKLVEDIVPNISKYANTQNKVNKADFFANHEFHRRIEQFSKETIVPAAEGELTGTKWYYESKRGSYKDMMSYKSPTEIKKIKAIYPPEKKVDKTEFAKHILSFEMKPYDVVKGAQYAFISLANYIVDTWEKNSKVYNREWYKEAISKSILFKGVDNIIKKSEWEFKAGGNKAVLTTYSIAWLTNYLEEKKLSFNFDKIWQEQGLEESLKSIFISIIPSIYEKMDTDAERALPQQAKTKNTWEKLKVARFSIDKKLIDKISIALEDKKLFDKQGQREQKTYDDLEAQMKVTELSTKGEWLKIETFARPNNLVNDTYNNILELIRRKKILNPKQSKDILKLYNKCIELGYK